MLRNKVGVFSVNTYIVFYQIKMMNEKEFKYFYELFLGYTSQKLCGVKYELKIVLGEEIENMWDLLTEYDWLLFNQLDIRLIKYVMGNCAQSHYYKWKRGMYFQ